MRLDGVYVLQILLSLCNEVLSIFNGRVILDVLCCIKCVVHASNRMPDHFERDKYLENMQIQC